MRVSLCMIVKNEEANLAACLGSVADLVSEVVVVDTGSTDQTRDIARSFGAAVHDHPWQDDFAAARNESLRHAHGDWVLWLDGDERLSPENHQRLATLLAGLTDENVGWMMKQRSPVYAATETVLFDQVRLFRNHPDIRWHYRVHEQILPAILRLGGRERRTDIVIEHAGYVDPAVYQRKQERYLALLERENQERPDDPFTLFNLGGSYQALGRSAEALQAWQRSLERITPGASFESKLYAVLVRGHQQLGQRRKALTFCQTGRSRFGNDIELLFREALVRRELDDLTGAAACLEELLELPPESGYSVGRDVGLRGHKARYQLGRIYAQQGRRRDAEAQLRAALAEQPTFGAAWMELGKLLLESGRVSEAEQILARLEAGPQKLAEAVELRVYWHLSRGDLTAARQLLEEIIPQAPHIVELRLALCKVLVEEGRDRAAAERAARAVLTLDPANLEAEQHLRALARWSGAAAAEPNTLTQALQAVRVRWPAWQSPSTEEPIFVLAAGWRCGSTLLQRMLLRRCLIWGEPFGRAMPIAGMAEQLRPFGRHWPAETAFVDHRPTSDQGKEWVANLYPPVADLVQAHLAYFHALFQVPAFQRGQRRWGLKEVRLSIDHARYLHWLFPRARFVFLYRDPYACYRSFVGMGQTLYRRWPDEPIDSPERFGQHWRTLLDGFLQHGRDVGGLVLRYEDLCAPTFDPAPLNAYLGLELDLAERAVQVGASPRRPVSPDELRRLRSVVEPLASRLGYLPPEDATRSGNAGKLG